MSLLEIQNVSGGYEGQSIVRDIFLSLQSGEWLSLIGANGSGKSTLLKLISRALAPYHGVVLLDGKAIHTQPAQAIAQQLAFLPQQQTIPTGLTVQQLVSLGRAPHQPWWQWDLSARDRVLVNHAIAQTQLQPLQDRPVEQLSGGERQRAFLALALAQDPKILLLDEPTTYLDLRHQLELLDQLSYLNRDNHLTIITVLHDINLAARYSDRLAMLREGCLWAVGEPENVLTPETLLNVFGIRAVALDTPVGLQICPISAASTESSAPSLSESFSEPISESMPSSCSPHRDL
ncbi:ABC transporter ATP-binding protein [Myxacorys almedinensis]|uniref:ATP-binding cassette domain-containing protein n=1 Tax=Myxacorys almedinensis A TaxID=2690445 RepID=A0A8J7Z394_9CYAN|nr:ABC transporter ATP-binding protein [Myxacorys almedinensis]NDJ19199.1 ATP-binding cassette domain-containing protein [Myxacorys almedinensis A]